VGWSPLNWRKVSWARKSPMGPLKMVLELVHLIEEAIVWFLLHIVSKIPLLYKGM
jgi:hypothetical protein